MQMKSLVRFWSLVAIVAAGPQLAPAQQAPAQLQRAVAAAGGRVIVSLQPEGGFAGARVKGQPPISRSELDRIEGRLRGEGRLRSIDKLPSVGAVVAEVTPAQLDALVSDPNVYLVEPDVFMPLQEAESTPAPAGRLAQTIPWGVAKVTAPETWAAYGTGAGVKVGIMDSGGDTDHPDLVWAGGYDFTSGSSSPSKWEDNISVCNGHGTHVAGTVAARDNSIGVVGVAPGVSLYALKVFTTVDGKCGAYASNQIAALQWAASNGIQVVNASLGGGTGAYAYSVAVSNAAANGTFLVAAAGNTGGGTVQYPAAYNDAIAVAALTSSDSRPSYSTYGSQIHIAAPGSSVESTMPGGGTASKSGTSMAAPHVTGVVALILSQYPGISISQLRQKLQDGALDVNATGWDQYTGWGRVRALNSIQGGGSTPPPEPLAMSVSPASRNVAVAAGSTAPSGSGTVTLTGDGAASAAWTANKKKSWTTLTTSSGTGSGTVAWSRNTTGLTPGVYVDTITVTASGATGSPDRIIDSLVITAAPEPKVLTVLPTSRRATIVAGSAAPTDSAQVQLTGDGASGYWWNSSNKADWSTITKASGQGSGMLRWSRDAAGLAPGTYVDTITVTASGGFDGSPSRVIDTLVITPAPVPLALAVSPKSRFVSAQAGSTAAGAEATVSLTGDGASTKSWTATKRKSWTTLTTSSGSGNGTVRWSRSTSGLTPGVYVDTITVTASGAAGSPSRVIDTLVITPAPVPLALSVSPKSRHVSAVAGTVAASDEASVNITGDGAASAAWSATKRKSWTTLTTSSGTGNGSVRWSRSTNGLNPGVYVDTITVTASGVTGSPSRVIDTLVITPAPVPLTLAVSPGSRYVSVESGSAAGSGDAAVSLSGDGSASKAWTASSRKSWTTLATSSGTGSGTVRWNRSTTGLTPGVYVDTITVTASGAAGSPSRVIDTLVITAPPEPRVMTVLPTSRRVTITAGTAAPDDSAEVRLTGDGASGYWWNSSNKASWSTVTKASGQGSGVLRWSRDAAGLAPGVYVDTITIAASGGFAGSPTRVIDTLVISAAPVPLALAVSPSSRYVAVQSGSVAAPGEAAVSLTGDGAATKVWSATKRKSWTTLTTSGGTGSGTVAWSRSTAGLTPGVYVDTITVTASGATGSPGTIIDSLVVSATPVPLALSVSPGSRYVSVQAGSAAASGEASVTVTGDGAATTVWTATRKKSWTALATSSGTGNGKVVWSRNTAGLTPGVYVDTITVTASGATGSPAQVIDSLVITAAPVALALSVSPGSRYLAVEAGSTAAAGEAAVAVTGDGAASTVWTATKRKSWTTLITGSGTGNGTVRWGRNAAGLAAGTYVDTITVTVNAAGLSGRVIDTLVITAPTPSNPGNQVALSRRGKRNKIDRLAGQALDDGVDSVRVEQAQAGQGGNGWVAVSSGSWLKVNTTSGNGPGQLRFARSYSSLAEGTHVDTITVTLASAPDARAFYVDTVVVTDVAAPAPSIAVRSLFNGAGLSAQQRSAFDLIGNRNGRFDLGDFLAWVRGANVRLSASEAAEVQAAIIKEAAIREEIAGRTKETIQ